MATRKRNYPKNRKKVEGRLVEYSEELEKKVLSCYGNLNYSSIAKVLGIPRYTVYSIMQRNGKVWKPRYNWKGERNEYN